jgi:hypothetical protein
MSIFSGYTIVICNGDYDIRNSMQTLILEISGGVIQQVYTDAKDLRVVKVDWDIGESPGDEACAGILSLQRLSILPAETRQAVAGFLK